MSSQNQSIDEKTRHLHRRGSGFEELICVCLSCCFASPFLHFQPLHVSLRRLAAAGHRQSVGWGDVEGVEGVGGRGLPAQAVGKRASVCGEKPLVSERFHLSDPLHVCSWTLLGPPEHLFFVPPPMEI